VVALPVPVPVIVTLPVVFVCLWFAKACSTLTVNGLDVTDVVAFVVTNYALFESC